MPERVTLSTLDDSTHEEVFAARPRTVRLRLDAGERVPPHDHPGTAVLLLVLSGGLDVRLDGEEYALDEGDVLRFDGERTIEPRARTATRALVVFAPAAE